MNSLKLADHFDMMYVFEINGIDRAAEADAYATLREMFGLSARPAIRAIARACTASGIPARMHSALDPTSNDHDARILPAHEWSRTFGQTLLSGRAEIATPLGVRQRAALKGRKPTGAVADERRDGGYVLRELTDEAPGPVDPGWAIGIDLGVEDLAATDEGETFSGDGIPSYFSSVVRGLSETIRKYKCCLVSIYVTKAKFDLKGESQGMKGDTIKLAMSNATQLLAVPRKYIRIASYFRER